MNNDFTVLLPTYNRVDLAEKFEAVLESCLNNTLLPKRILVVVDGPVSSLFEEKICKYESHELIDVLWLDENLGLTKALNIGLREITTKYVVRADGDDLNRPYRFQRQMEVLEEGYELVSGAVIEYDAGNNYIATKRVPLTQSEIHKFAKRRNPFNHTAVAYKLDLAISLGGYPDVYLKEDWGLWALMLGSGVRCCNLEEVLVDVAGGDALYARRGGMKNFLSEFSIQRHLVKHLNKSVFIALCDFFGRSILMNLPASLKAKAFLRMRKRT